MEPVSYAMGSKVGYYLTPRLGTKPAFAEYLLRYSMDLVELGATSMDLVDLEFLSWSV
jgi:hypothetical protein